MLESCIFATVFKQVAGDRVPCFIDVAIMISRETIEAIVAEKLEEENLLLLISHKSQKYHNHHA
jgi:hypothetical protein